MSKVRLLSPVTRWIFIGSKEFACTLENDLSITFREKGRKTSFNVPLAACYNLCIINQARKEKAGKTAKNKARKSAGLRTRNVSKVDASSFFDRKYAEALAIKN